MNHTHRYRLLLSAAIYLLLSFSLQPLYAAQCSLPRLTSGTPVALVIANRYNRTLQTPVNDAYAIKTVLKSLGFRVIFKTELNEKEMNKATVEFADCLQISQGVGLFYFSGYGMQLYRKNYLIPVDITIMDEFDVQYETLSVDKMLKRLTDVNNQLNIIILDASRENPYPNFSTTGLASISSPNGFFISYPTEPDKTVEPTSRNKNSLYVRKLVQVLKPAKQNHTRIEDVFMQVNNAVEQESNEQQIPWSNGSLKKRFCFGGCRNQTYRPPRTRPRPPRNATTKLIVLSNIDGAYVYINNQFAGTIQAGRIEKQWPQGRVTVRVEKNGYTPFEKLIHLRTTRRLSAQLEPVSNSPRPILRPSVGF